MTNEIAELLKDYRQLVLTQTPWKYKVTAERIDKALAALHSPSEAVGEVESEDAVCEEEDGCPTEGARLKREWRQLQSRRAELEAAANMAVERIAWLDSKVAKQQERIAKLKRRVIRQDWTPDEAFLTKAAMAFRTEYVGQNQAALWWWAFQQADKPTPHPEGESE